MHTDTRTPDQIERDIERERAGLADTVDALQDRFSVDGVLREVTDGVRRHGGELGSAVTRSAKQNPMALAVTGIGLAWLIFGRSHDETRDDGYRRAEGRSADHGEWPSASGSAPAYRPQHTRGDMYEPYGAGRSYPRTAPAHRTVGMQGPGYPSWARHDLDDYADWESDESEPMGRRAADTARSGAASARDSAKGAADTVRSGAKSAADTVGSGANAAAETAKGAARDTADRMSRVRERLSRGTEDLNEAARERVIAARARAVEMAERADAAARKNYARGRDATAGFIEDQPLVAGAIALAVGAALAGALPRTRREDEALGEARDDLFDEAERIFNREREKAERVAHAAADEATRIAEEKRDAVDDAAPGEKSAVEAAADEVRDAGKRVRDAAEREAEKEDLGKPRS